MAADNTVRVDPEALQRAARGVNDGAEDLRSRLAALNREVGTLLGGQFARDPDLKPVEAVRQDDRVVIGLPDGLLFEAGGPSASPPPPEPPPPVPVPVTEPAVADGGGTGGSSVGVAVGATS